MHDPTATEHLSAPDAAAVDALFDAAMDPATVTSAHRTLAEECRRQDIPFRPFKDFQAVLLALREVHLNGNQPTSGEEAQGKDGDSAGGGEEALR